MQTAAQSMIEDLSLFCCFIRAPSDGAGILLLRRFLLPPAAVIIPKPPFSVNDAAYGQFESRFLRSAERNVPIFGIKEEQWLKNRK